MQLRFLQSITFLGLIAALGCTPQLRSYLVQPIEILGPTTLIAGECIEYTARQVSNSFPGEVLLSATQGSTYADSNCQIALNSIELSGGNPEQKFYFYSEVAGGQEISAFSLVLNAAGLKQVRVDPDVLSDIEFEIPNSATAATNFNMSVRLVDQFGNVTTTSGGSISFERREAQTSNFVALTTQTVNSNQGVYSVSASIDKAVLHTVRMSFQSYVKTDDIQINVGSASSIELTNFGSLNVTVNSTRSLNVSVKDAGGNLTSADIRLLSNAPGAQLPSDQTCNQTCVFNNIQFTQIASSIYLRAAIVGNLSLFGELSPIDVVNQNSIRIAKNPIYLGEPIFVDALIDADAQNPNTRFEWDFGVPNGSGEGIVESFVYNTVSAPNFTITLTVRTANQTPRVYTRSVQVLPSTSLPNQILYFISPNGTAPGDGSSQTTPTNLAAAIADIESKQTIANQSPLTINMYLQRRPSQAGSDRYVINGNRVTTDSSIFTAFKVNGTGRITMMPYGSTGQSPLIYVDGQSTLPSNSNASFMYGDQDGLVVRDIVFSTAPIDRVQNPTTDPKMIYFALNGSDQSFHRTRFEFANMGFRAKYVGTNRQSYMQFERRGFYGCEFEDSYSSAIFDLGGRYLALKGNLFEYSRNHLTQFGESERVNVSGNEFKFSEAVQFAPMSLWWGALTFFPGVINQISQPIRDIQITHNRFFGNLKNIEIFPIPNAPMNHMRIERNEFLSDESELSSTQYYRNMQRAIYNPSLNNFIVQNNFFSRAPGAELMQFIAIELGIDGGQTLQNTTIRHNSFFAEGERILGILSHTEHSSLDLRFNIFKFLQITPPTSSSEINFPEFVASGSGSSDGNYGMGVFNLRKLSQSQLQSSIFSDGRSVIEVPLSSSFLEQFHFENGSEDYNDWHNTLNLGAGDVEADPMYIAPYSHDLHIQYTSPAVDLSGINSVIIDIDLDERDAMNDSGADEAEEDPKGGGEPGEPGDPRPGDPLSSSRPGTIDIN